MARPADRSASWRELSLLNLAMICIATSGALGRSLSITPSAAIFWRSVIAVLLMVAYCRYRGLTFAVEGRRNQLAVLLGGVLMTAHWVTYFYALAWSNVAVSMISVFTYPAITTLLEPLLLKKRFQPVHLLLGGLVLLGVLLMAPSVDLADDTTAGIGMGLTSATLYALRNILMKTQVDSVQGSVLMTYQAGIAVLILSPVLFFDSPLPPAGDWPELLGLGIVTTAVGHTLFLNSFRYFSVSTASLISSIQPVYGILLGFLVLGEVPAWSAVGGGVLILLSVVIEARRAGK